MADQHLGNPGTDVERVFHEADIIAATPNMYCIELGDTIDSNAIAKLQHLNFNHRQTKTDEIVLAEELFRRLGRKLVARIGGNHEGWIQDLTGIDLLRMLVRKHSPRALYDSDDCLFTLKVGSYSIRVRARHKWRGRSRNNPTNGIESLQRYDQDFELGIGAHDHTSGLARQFTAGGKRCMAVLCGTYKRIDTYAKELGVPMANPSTAVAIIIDPEGASMSVTDNLESAARYMEAVHGTP